MDAATAPPPTHNAPLTTACKLPTPATHPPRTCLLLLLLQSLASQLFAMSLFPYLAFLFYLHRCGKTPKLTLIGFYFLLAFVGATIPAGIYGGGQRGRVKG